MNISALAMVCSATGVSTGASIAKQKTDVHFIFSESECHGRGGYEVTVCCAKGNAATIGISVMAVVYGNLFVAGKYTCPLNLLCIFVHD